MFFKRLMAVVLTMAMLCSMISFAQTAEVGEAQVNTVSAEGTAAVPTQQEINKAATGFIDINPGASYAEDLKKLVEFGIISGYPDGTFRPEGQVTRAEMCKMINLALGYTDFEGAQGFSDVSSANWYYTYALAAQKQGYIEGYNDGTFKGGKNISRQEVCAILNRILKPMDLGIPVTINDTVSSWARPHVEIIVQNYIMTLEENNTFRATENLKRHELATVLSNMAIGPVKQIEADVRFFVNGEQYGETQTVMVGSCAVVPEAPAVPGADYVFEGWRPIGTLDVVDVSSLMVVADVDYEAVFSKKTHDVTFYNRGGAVHAACVVEHGSIVTAPANPVAKGFKFLGWSLTDGGSVVKLSETKITDNTNFYAVFEKEQSENGGGGATGGSSSGGEETTEKTYFVSFFVNGDLVEEQSVLKNGSPKKPADPVFAGHVFLGWSFTPDGELVSPSSIKVTSSVTLYAVFEKEEEPEPEVFTVTFYADGKEHDTQFVESGKTPSSVSNPTKEGYTFKYWSKTEGGSEVKLGYFTVTSNTDFYAVFEKKAEEKKYCTVTFKVDNAEYDTLEVEEGKTASAPTAPTKDGYDFKGWSLSSGGSVISVSSVTITSDTTFHAIFEKIKPKEYTVTFDVDGTTHATKTVVENEKASVPANPTKDGYIFKGWAEENGGEPVDVGSVVITGPKKFYAVFEEKKAEVKTYTVTFVVDGNPLKSQEVQEGEKLTMPSDPEKAGYEFLGWSETNGGKVVTVSETVTKNVTYYAVFKEIIKHKVTFYVNGKFYKSSDVVDGETASVPSNPSVNGYNFSGWSKTEGGDPITVSSVKITEDTSFYAVLKKIEPEKVYYDVIFMSDGKKCDSQSVEEGGKASVPADPEKAGHDFIGWSIKSGSTETVDVSSVVIKEKTTFYAVFKKIPVYYDVVFMVNDKEHDKQSVLEGDCPDVPDEPVLEGYDFLGWSKTKGGSTVYPDKTVVTGNTTYYAVFEEEEVVIKYYKVFFWVENEVYKNFEVAEGEKIDAPADPTELGEGVSFLGWSLDESNVIEVSDIVIDDHTDFYAVLVGNPNDPELMEMLERGYKQLGKIIATGRHKKAINVIRECVKCIIDDANNGVYIDKTYVKKNYNDMIADVDDLVNKKMTPEERSNFINMITNEDNIKKDVQDFLIDYFDIDTSDV